MPSLREFGCVTIIPKTLREELAGQIEQARKVWQEDRMAGLAGVHIDVPPGHPLRAGRCAPVYLAPLGSGSTREEILSGCREFRMVLLRRLRSPPHSSSFAALRPKRLRPSAVFKSYSATKTSRRQGFTCMSRSGQTASV